MKYALFFLVVAAQFFVEAALLGGYFWIFAWPGVSFGLVGIAYLGLGPVIFGKRASGNLAWWSTLLLFPYLVLTWLTWHLVRRLSSEDCYNEVAPGIFVGRRPLPGELPPEVSLLVDLTAEFPEHSLVRAGREYLAAPMLDAGIASAAAFRKLVEHIARWEGPVYIHCAQGHGRTGTLAAAVLVAKGLHASQAHSGQEPTPVLTADLRLEVTCESVTRSSFPTLVRIVCPRAISPKLASLSANFLAINGCIFRGVRIITYRDISFVPFASRQNRASQAHKKGARI